MKIRAFFAGILIAYSPALFAAGNSYVDESVKLFSITPASEQAQAWGTCAATYRLMAAITQENTPAQAKRLTELGNGAQMAVQMAILVPEIKAEITPSQFEAAWNTSKMLGQTIPETAMTTLVAGLEADTSEGKSAFMNDLSKTVSVCINNLDGQQTYIDIWREIAKSGMLAFPD